VKIHRGDRVTICEPDAEPYDADVLSIDPDTGEMRIRAHMPYEATLRLRPGIRITPTAPNRRGGTRS